MKTGLFRAIRKRLSLTHDNDMGAFREKINLLVQQKDKLSDEEIASKVEELKGLCSDLPEGEDKSKLDRFLDDFAQVKSQDANVAKGAAGEIADLFEKLDAKAMEDAPETSSAKDGDMKEADKPEEKADETAKEDVEKTSAPKEKKETLDGDENASKYTLEEVYQFIKNRLAKDEGCKEAEDDGEKVEEETDDEEGKETEDGEEKKESVNDHAPFIAVKMTKDHKPKNGLDDLMAMLKGEKKWTKTLD